jgi:V-type H+-transporting ATPase subunit D
MGRVMQLASFSMAEVTYAIGDISYLVQEQAKSATFKVKAKQENVSGVVLPAFEVDRGSGSGTHFMPLPHRCLLNIDGQTSISLD